MCDAFLVLAQAQGGLSCFLVPRWRPDGAKNPLQIVRLKRKMGNMSNASSETELRGALGWMVGPEGRGIATIIEMVAMTRFDCMIGSAAGMRMAVSQAIDHCRQRKAFGALLVDQPIMSTVLADLAIESEAALALTMRIARALDHRDDPHEDALVRLGTAIGKYWICKRTPGHAYEALECIGGSGLMEDSPMPRLYREAPVNAIWEGSGNVQCLDIARAIKRSPQTLEAYFAEVSSVRGASAALDRAVAALKDDLARQADFESRARDLCDRLALCLEAAALLRAGSPIADIFCLSRLEARGAHHYGALSGVNTKAIVERAAPR
jgi:putative acyl-CoA dehydrogenase